MTRRSIAAAIGLWLAVVIVVANVTWFVIDRAGRTVGASPAQASAVGSDAETAPGAATEPWPSIGTPGDFPPGSGSGAPSPTTGPSNTPGGGLATTQAFTSSGGNVRVACVGSRLDVLSVRPRDGWRFEKRQEDDSLEVTFRMESAEAEVKIRCRSGVPTLVGGD